MLQNVEHTGGIYGSSTEADIEYLVVIVCLQIDQTCARLFVFEGVHVQRQLGERANFVQTETGIQASKSQFIHGWNLLYVE